jgi:4-alpha-glucanotransferase
MPDDDDAARWGIAPGYHDVAEVWHEAPQATIRALLDVMGADGDDPPPGSALIAAPGRPRPTFPRGGLRLEDGTTVAVDGEIPIDVPLGYHRFVADDGAETDLIVSPGRCFLPDDLLAWGWAAQLYASRSHASWGMGDLADLRRIGEWSAAKGARITLVNPLHAALPVGRQQSSPYFASSRCFRNPLYLRIEELPGADQLPDLAELAARGRALNGDRRIDRDAVWELKSAALEALFARFTGDLDFDRYREKQGQSLRQYATFCALSERYGLPWEKWPDEARRPDGPGIELFAAEAVAARRIRYHEWLQWRLDQQLRAASGVIGLVQDLAIGADAGGADAWRWQDCMALGVRVGAPPDEFNTAGQDWGLPPFDPWKLRSGGYRPFVELARAGMLAGGGMRFDHVMGLFRLYWIPVGASASEGAYVAYPYADLLDILALESHRAQALVVGEDLGTVEKSFRTELAARAVLSYRLVYFEDTPPGSGDWPRQALAAATTHDLPTVAGLWTGSDVAARLKNGVPTNEAAEAALRAKMRRWIDAADEELLPAEAVRRVYGLLGAAPCALVTATLDDAIAVEERPNMPGTVDEWPNWCIALPQTLDEIEACPLAEAIATTLTARGALPSGST